MSHVVFLIYVHKFLQLTRKYENISIWILETDYSRKKGVDFVDFNMAVHICWREMLATEVIDNDFKKYLNTWWSHTLFHSSTWCHFWCFRSHVMMAYIAQLHNDLQFFYCQVIICSQFFHAFGCLDSTSVDYPLNKSNVLHRQEYKPLRSFVIIKLKQKFSPLAIVKA